MLSNCSKNRDGKPGDSSGKEYAIQNWYSGPWNCVLRHPDKKLREKIAQVATKAAKNDLIRYSQPNRLTYYNHLKKNKWDPSKITEKCEADCSSSTAANIIAAAKLVDESKYKRISMISPGMTTFNMRTTLKGLGFEVLTATKFLTSDQYLLPGDILLNDSAHVAINVGTGDYAEAISEAPKGTSIVMKEAIAKLFSSDNYAYLKEDEEKEGIKQAREMSQKAMDYFLKVVRENNQSVLDNIVGKITEKIEKEHIEKVSKKNKIKKLSLGNLLSFPTLVEAPFIELSFNGVVIGGYGNAGDKYPNYITSLNIEKINGRINQYTINLVYQIRPGEDPNAIDKLLSRTGYTNTLKIRYGDAAIGTYFKEEEAVIMGATHQEDPTASKITYSIKAVSSLARIQNSSYTFSAKTAKPSSELFYLLYENPETSKELLAVFPGMSNRSQVASLNLIPTNDKEIVIPGGNNMSGVERLNQVVSYMQNLSNPHSSYFLTFLDDKGKLGGSVFKITELVPIEASASKDELSNSYYVDVGYPGNNFVTNFSVTDNLYWPIYFKYSGSIPKYNYNIDRMGNLQKEPVNALTLNRYLETDVTRMNWWQSLTAFPISATLTIKGLMKPTMLMENVFIYAQFYGEEDMTSGIYSIIGQQDKIDSSGYTTTLSLLRVQK